MSTDITEAQAEAIYLIRSNGVTVGFCFDPYIVFPNHDNKDAACRRTCKTLAQRGLLLRPTGIDHLYYIFTQAAVDAMIEWTGKHNNWEIPERWKG